MGSPINESPGLGLSQVTAETLEGREVYFSGSSRIRGKLGDGVSDVHAADHVGVHQFTEDAAIAEAHFGGEGG